jgi:hypothetical protein
MNGNRHKSWLLETRASASIFLRVSTKRQDTAACVSLSFIYDFKERPEPRLAARQIRFALSARAILDIGCSLQQSRHFLHFFQCLYQVTEKTPSMSQPPRPVSLSGAPI